MMKFLIIFFSCFLSTAPAFAETDLEKLIENHIFYTYSPSKIQENIYVVYNYKAFDDWKQDQDVSSSFYRSETRYPIFYIWNGRYITSYDAVGWDNANGMHVICKRYFDYFSEIQTCFSSINLEYTDKDIWIAVLKEESFSYWDEYIPNKIDLWNYEENDFIEYGIPKDLSTSKYLELKKSSYSQKVDLSFSEQGDIISDTKGMVFPTFIFYNNSFFGIDTGKKVILKKDIDIFLENIWDKISFSGDKDMIDKFLKNNYYFQEESTYSHPYYDTSNYIRVLTLDGSLYENLYRIEKPESFSWSELFLLVDRKQDTDQFSDDYLTIHDKIEELNSFFPQTFTWTNYGESMVLLPINTTLFSFSVKDIVKEYEEMNTYFSFRVYEKQGEQYSLVSDINKWYFILNKTWKKDEILSLVKEEEYIYSLYDKITEQLISKLSELSEIQRENIKEQAKIKQEILEKNLENKLENIVQEIKSEEDFSLQYTNIRKIKDKNLIINRVHSFFKMYNSKTWELDFDPILEDNQDTSLQIDSLIEEIFMSEQENHK